MSRIHIALLGSEPLPVYYPIAEDRPDMVYMIYTNQNHSISQRLRHAIDQLGCKTFQRKVNAFDMKEVIAVCEQIHAGCPPGSDYTYNITGGTKLMAIGAYTVATRHGAKVIYTDSQSRVNLSTFEKTPLVCALGTKLIFTLQGQRVKSYTVYKDDEATLACANEIKDYITKYGSQHSALVRDYMAWKGNLPQEWQNGKATCLCKGHQIEVYVDEVNALRIDHPNAKMMLFEGRWWEILTAHAISVLTEGKYEIWHDVKFQPKDMFSVQKDIDKNEVDLLFNIGNTIVFIECKSGNVTQDNIYKMKFIRETYGSEKSRSVLVSFHSVNKQIKEKAQEAKVDVICRDRDHSALERMATNLNTILHTLKA